MEGLVKGDVVVTPFPYSDLTQSKRRPALVVAVLDENDLILCQITSRRGLSRYGIPISNADFITGSLSKNSQIRPETIHTLDRGMIRYKVGSLYPEKGEEVIRKIVELIGKELTVFFNFQL